MRALKHVEWIRLCSQKISRILGAYIGLNYRFFAQKFCGQFSGLIWLTLIESQSLVLFGSCFHNKISEKFTFCCHDLVDNCHHLTVKILTYQDTLDRKSNAKTLAFSLHHLSVSSSIFFVDWDRFQLCELIVSNKNRLTVSITKKLVRYWKKLKLFERNLRFLLILAHAM